MKTGNGLISEPVLEALSYRIHQEEMSSRLYFAMSSWFDLHGFMGAAALWKQYAEEEADHVMWAVDYLLANDYLPERKSLLAPTSEFGSFADILEKSYDHEITITKQCNNLAKIAAMNGDYQTVELAHKYLDEQTEELEKTNSWVAMLDSFGESKEALALIDERMKCKANK